MITKFIPLFLILTSSFAIDEAQMNKKVDLIVKKYKLGDAKVGIYIDSKSDKDRAPLTRNNEISFTPASTFKLLTAYYVLETLGPTHRFKTTFAYKGEVKNNILDGDLILNTSADPFLLSPELYNMAIQLKARGITQVQGDLIIGSPFPNLPRIGNVGLDDQAYNQGLSGLNLDFNRFKVVRNGNSFNNFPKNDFLQVVKSDSKLSPGEIFKRIGDEIWSAHKLPKYYYEVPIRESLKTNAAIFKEILEKMGITVTGQTLFEREHKQFTKVVYTKESATVLELVTSGLEYSNNLFMETLIIQATKEDNLFLAANKMRAFLHQRFPTLKFNEVFFENGSGLSVITKLAPWQIAKFLGMVKFSSYQGKSFMSLLSLAGHSGFLAKKYLNNQGFQSFFAKTGSLDFVNGICGVSADKYTRSFCIFINDFEKRKKLNAKNSVELNNLREQAKSWKRSTDQILEKVLNIIL